MSATEFVIWFAIGALIGYGIGKLLAYWWLDR